MMREGDKVEINGEEWTVGRHMAYRGKPGCTNPTCTTKGDPDCCYGWHCSQCDEPCSMMGHECPSRN